MIVVVADTSPLHYLVLIDLVELLVALYERVLVPQAVVDELTHASAPAAVRGWVRRRPDWLEVRSPLRSVDEPRIDVGERDAIALSIEVGAALLVIDDLDGRRAAERRHGLATIGLLGLLRDAAIAGHLPDFDAALARLRETQFRAAESLYETVKAQVRASRTGRP